MIELVRHFIACYKVYRHIESTAVQSALSAFYKPFLHYIFFKNPNLGYKLIKNKYFHYHDGIWSTIHFGANHYRPLMTKQSHLYLRGEKVPSLDQFETNAEFLFIDHQSHFLEILHSIKSSNIIMCSIDGSFGVADTELLVGGHNLKLKTSIIKSGELMSKGNYFELYFIDNKLKLRRHWIRLSANNFPSEIEQLCSEVFKKYPHNIRLGRLE